LDTVNIIYIVSRLLEFTDVLNVWTRLWKIYAFGITYTTCHLQGIKQAPCLRFVFKTR